MFALFSRGGGIIPARATARQQERISVEMEDGRAEKNPNDEKSNDERNPKSE